MWVARDKESFMGHELILYAQNPTRMSTFWTTSARTFQLPTELFPDLTWENEPMEVELIPINNV